MRIKHHFCNLISFFHAFEDDDKGPCIVQEWKCKRGAIDEEGNFICETNRKRNDKERKVRGLNWILWKGYFSVSLLFDLSIVTYRSEVFCCCFHYYCHYWIPRFKSKLMQKCHKRGKLNVILWVMDECEWWCL